MRKTGRSLPLSSTPILGLNDDAPPTEQGNQIIFHSGLSSSSGSGGGCDGGGEAGSGSGRALSPAASAAGSAAAREAWYRCRSLRRARRPLPSG